MNRYSYCLNNPLKYTDPSGYQNAPIYDYHSSFSYENNPYFTRGGSSGGSRMSWNLGTIYNFDGSLNIAGPSFEDLFIKGVDGDWIRKSDLEKDVVARYVSKDAYTSVGAQRYYKGSTLHLVREPYSLVTMRENASSSGVIIDNTAQALSHYLFGDGSPARIGPKTVSAMLHHPDFALGHYQVMNYKLKKPYFYVDMTWTVFHIGDTKVSVSIDEKNRHITYTLFDGDSFSDPDFVDEYFLKGNPYFESDGLGPNLERFGGTPYYYIPVNITFSY